MPQDRQATQEPARTFVDFLKEVEDGRVVEDLTTQTANLLAEMFRQAAASGGTPKGKIALTLNFQVDRDMIDVNAQIAVTEPRPVRQRSIFFPTRDGLPSAAKRRQLEIDLETRDVSTRGAADVKPILQGVGAVV